MLLKVFLLLLLALQELLFLVVKGRAHLRLLVLPLISHEQADLPCVRLTELRDVLAVFDVVGFEYTLLAQQLLIGAFCVDYQLIRVLLAEDWLDVTEFVE